MQKENSKEKISENHRSFIIESFESFDIRHGKEEKIWGMYILEDVKKARDSFIISMTVNFYNRNEILMNTIKEMLIYLIFIFSIINEF